MQDDVSTVGPTLNGGVQPAQGGGALLVVMEQRSLARYPLLATQPLRIGRAEDCDVVLRDPMASRLHAILHPGPPAELEDLGSRNGTRVRHELIAAATRMPLRHGDSFQIGNVILILQGAPRVRRDARATGMENSTRGAEFVTRDAAMLELHSLVERIAPGSISVLILGETGVGKEVIAEKIHRSSGQRSRGPFVRINCASLSDSLFESELFGHERGSFTGAVRSKPGMLEVASGGTAFLDEVGELPLAAQAKLLRALESREICRVGSVTPQPIDVRFIAATNRDLRADVARGKFREDLFFRLAGASLSVPPLRQRPSELEPLLQEFLTDVSTQLDRPTPRISEAALKLLRAHSWPGNIRELKNVIECAVLRVSGEVIEPGELPPELLEAGPACEVPLGVNHAGPTMIPPAMPDAAAALSPTQQAERERIVRALSACHGNQTRAALQLGMPRRTLVAKLSAYGIPRPRKIEADPSGE